MIALLLVLALLVWLAAPARPGDHPGFDQGRLDRTIELTRIMLVSPISLALVALATSLCNARRRFAALGRGPAHLRRRDHRRGELPRADDGSYRPGDRRRRRSRSATSPFQLEPLRWIGFR